MRMWDNQYLVRPDHEGAPYTGHWASKNTQVHAAINCQLNGEQNKPNPPREFTLAPGPHGALQALLFIVALCHLSFGYFDRNPIDPWPQNHVGVAASGPD